MAKNASSNNRQTIYFDFFSKDADKLSEGVYELMYDKNLQPSMTVDYSFMTIQTPVSSKVDFIDVVSGEVIVLRNGTTYEITFNCVADNGQKVQGHFSRFMDIDRSMNMKQKRSR